MKYANGKRNKALFIGVLLYCVMFFDIILNTAIAHISNYGAPRITNAIMLGPVVLNPISVLPVFIIGILFVFAGLVLKHKNRII